MISDTRDTEIMVPKNCTMKIVTTCVLSERPLIKGALTELLRACVAVSLQASNSAVCFVAHVCGGASMNFLLVISLLLVCALLLPLHAANDDIGKSCKHSSNKNTDFQPEVYYINMDRSTARRKATEEQVGRLCGLF